MKQKIIANLQLIIGLAIPVGILLFTAAVIYVPQLFRTEKPTYDFVYAVSVDTPGFFDSVLRAESYPQKPMEGSVFPRFRYEVLDKKLVRIFTATNTPEFKELKNVTLFEPNVRFYLHRAATNESTLITSDDAMKYTLDTWRVAPDGFEFLRGDYRESIGGLFFGGYNNTPSYYLRKNSAAIRLPLLLAANEYYRDDLFVGWIIE